MGSATTRLSEPGAGRGQRPLALAVFTVMAALGPVDSWIGKFDTFAIGNETVRNPTIHFSDMWRHVTSTPTGTRLAQPRAGLPQMFLGVDFLRAHRVLIAYSQQKVYFTYVGGTVFPARQGRPCSDAATKDGATSGRGEN